MNTIEIPPEYKALPTIDLKWACWSADAGYWEEYAPEALEAIRRAWEGTGPPVRFCSSPRKEIRYGEITVEKERTWARFTAVWDSPRDLVSCTGIEAIDNLSDEELEIVQHACWEYFCDGTGFLDSDPESPIGAQREGTVEGGFFGEMLARVDAIEEAVFKAEQEHSAEFDEWLRGWAEEEAQDYLREAVDRKKEHKP